MNTQCSIHPGDFRKALGTFATGITIVTAVSATGEPVGLTVNSFTSVSLEPPLILWCLANTSDNLQVFQKAEYFAVNILAANQYDLANHFAKRQKDKFDRIKYRSGMGKVPLIDDCVTWLQCRSTTHTLAGDHHIFIGEVERIETTEKEALLYHQGTYAMSLPLPVKSVVTNKLQIAEQGQGDLYTLLIQAVHNYQEKLESRQYQLVQDKYEARLLILLFESAGYMVDDLSHKIQLPLTETTAILLRMQDKGLIISEFKQAHAKIMLSNAGRNLAELLWNLVKRHETDAMALMDQFQGINFKQGLLKLSEWGNHEYSENTEVPV